VKRSVLVAFCIFALCSLLVANAGTVNAATASGYGRTDTPTNTTYPNTVDGTWSPPEEWFDANFTGGNATHLEFGSTWDSPDSFTNIYSRWIIQLLNDDTDDAGDYWEMCIDAANAGGSAPTTATHKIRIDGHDTLTLYEGDGSGWVEVTPDTDELVWNNSIAASPWLSTPHWILEMDIHKNGGNALCEAIWGVRVAAYDASNATQGEIAWPPGSDVDDPDTWGTQYYGMSPDGDYWETVPEGFSIAIVVVLSTAAMVVGFYFLRKKAKPDSLNLAKARNTNRVC
jgi:hypothetical protein